MFLRAALPMDVWAILPAKTASGSVHSPPLATQRSGIFSKLIYPPGSCSAALWLLHPGAQSLGLTLVWAMRAGEQPPSAPSCLPAIISKLSFLFATHQELDWIQKAPTFTKSCKSQPESPNLLGNNQILPGCTERCLHLCRG